METYIVASVLLKTIYALGFAGVGVLAYGEIKENIEQKQQ